MTTLLAPCSVAPGALRAGLPLDESVYESVRRRMVLDYCKWDPQVGDSETIGRFPLILSRAAWKELASAAERLTSETLELERRLLARPALFARLGLPRRLRLALCGAADATITPAAARVLRFDFHLTRVGWRISEVNSDVPGGFTESSALSAMVAANVDDADTVGDPARAYADALARFAEADGDGGRGAIALLSAPGFMEDHQVVANLARLFRERGVDAHACQPHHLTWRDGRASLACDWHTGPVAGIVRFYQGEWLGRLKPRIGWHYLFVGGVTPVANPGVAILSESKRLPLLWDELGADVPAWRHYLPETRDPRDVPWRHEDSWLLKTAYCNTGDSVTLREITPAKQWLRTCLDVLISPREWTAQRRFDTSPIETPAGPRFACVGVYTIDGRACGAYGRISRTPVVRYDATDVAVLVEREGEAPAEPRFDGRRRNTGSAGAVPSRHAPAEVAR
jgi:Glutathionylspermidine synthase preATP-grasp